MRPEEGTYLAHREGNPFLGLLPREHAHFSIRREHRGLHRDSVRMRQDIIRPDITMEIVDKFLTKMYRTNPDFVWRVTRDFVRNCRTPVLILPDDVPAHPYVVAMECAMLAPKAEVSMFPWKEPKERIPLAVRQIRSFLRAHRPASS